MTWLVLFFSLDSIAVEHWFSNSSWCQNKQEHLIKILRSRPYPASRCLGLSFFYGLPRPQSPCYDGVGWGGEMWTLETPFHLSLESGPKKAMPRDRQDFSLCLLKPSVGVISMGCSDRVGVGKRRERRRSGEFYLP